MSEITDDSTPDAVSKGVENAFDYWLLEHPVSAANIIEDAIRDAFGNWLDAHSGEIIPALRSSPAPSEQRETSIDAKREAQ
jgi:hypothetical protein